MPFAKINGQDIFFEDSGGTGPALLFMHGFLMDQSLFDSQVALLSNRYRCIRWDARCFGQTRWDGIAFNLYDSASDGIGLMNELGISSAVLVGMSQGGYCALRMAIRYPERVRALVLMSTQAGVDDESKKPIYFQTRDTWKEMGPIQPLLEGLATALIGPREKNEQHWEKWLPRWKEISGDRIYHAMNNLLNRDDITSELSKILCPALVTHGTEDYGMPMELGVQLSKNLPGCKGFVPVPGAAHTANLTHAQIIQPRLEEFLEKYLK